jgi:LCP family protein required for cell wall assembly
MAERGGNGPGPQEGTPEYEWLYGTGQSGDRRYSDGQYSDGQYSDGQYDDGQYDPEPTRVLPTTGGRPQGPAQATPQDPQRVPPPGARRETGRPGRVEPPPSRAVPGPRRPPPRRRLGWLKLLVLLWVVFLIAVPVWAWSKVAKVDAEPSGARPANQPGTTYLLVGSDSRQGLTAQQRKRLGTGQAQGRRTDTIMLLHTGSGPNVLVSIPRDSIVDIPGHGRTKINAAYAYGGPRLLVKTLEEETGIRIDDFVEIGFGGFVGVVDAVGGITICPKTAMKDPLANLDIRKGCQQVNGVTALGYARSRHTSALGDIDRARHQREVVSAIGRKAASPWSVLNPVRYVSLASAGAQALTVGKNTGPLALAKFAWAMTHVNGKNGLTCGVPIADLAVHWDRARALALFKLIKEDHADRIPKDLCTPSGLPGR